MRAGSRARLILHPPLISRRDQGRSFSTGGKFLSAEDPRKRSYLGGEMRQDAPDQAAPATVLLHGPGSSGIFSRLLVLLSADWSRRGRERGRGRGRQRERERENFLSFNTAPSLVGLHSHPLLCEMPPTHSAAPQHCDLKPLKWDASRERERK